MRFVVALSHLVCCLGRIEPLLVSLAAGSPAATSLATASSWHSSARPAQRRPAPLHPLPCRTQQGVGEVGEVVARWANLNALRGNSGTNEDNSDQRAPTERSLYGIIQQRQHGTARLGQLPLAHTTHSVTQSGLSHLPTQLTKGSVAPSKVNWLHLPPLRDQIRAGTRPALLPILLQLIEYYCCRLRL